MEENIQLRIFIFIAVTACIIVHTKASHDLGCFREQGSPLYFSLMSMPPHLITRQKCNDACVAISKDYAVLRAGMSCFCSDIDPIAQLPLETGKCSLPCPGDLTETCGGYSHVNVLKVKRKVKGKITVTPSKVSTGDTVSITTDTSPPDSAYLQSMSFEDTTFSDEVINGSSLQSWKWYVAGPYTVTSQMSDDEGLYEATASTATVNVNSPVLNATLNCPTHAATFEPVEIPITVLRGTGVSLDVKLTDSLGTDSHEVVKTADAQEDRVGNSIVPCTNSSTIGPNDLVVINNGPVEFDGRIAGIEFWGTGSDTIGVHIFSPGCTGGEEYCPWTHTCALPASCGVACGLDEFCSSKQDCCSSFGNTNNTLLPAATYSNTWSMNINIAQGHGYVELTDYPPISKGDVIAFYGSSAIGTTWSESSDYHCISASLPTSFIETECNVTPELHMLSAVYVQELTATYGVVFNEIGSHTIEVTATNDQTDTDTCLVQVMEGVNFCHLNVPQYIARGELTTLAVMPHTGGTPTDLYIDFGDGINTTVTDIDEVTHTYTVDGIYTVFANVSNAVSSKTNTTTVHVMERISGFEISLLDGVEAHLPEPINLTMATGSNYTCNYEFKHEDGSIDYATTVESDGPYIYTFDKHGDYIITVTCSNSISTGSDTKTVRSVERISKVALTPAGAKVDTYFTLRLTWATGSDVTILYFTYNNTPINMQVDPVKKEAVSTRMIEASLTTIPITFQLTNPLNTVTQNSATFSIEVPITNAKLGCTFSPETSVVLPVEINAVCTVNMTAGTSVEIIIQWDDGNNYTVAASAYEPWQFASATLGNPILHTYSTPGTYTMSITARNAVNEVSEMYEVMVLVDVTGLFLTTTNNTRPFNPPAIFDFYLDGFSALPPYPTDFSLNVSWGDGTMDLLENVNKDSVILHTYQDRDGDLTVDYTIFNQLSNESGSLPVYVVAPIENPKCYVNPKAGLPGGVVVLSFSSDRGPPGNSLELVFDCDTSVGGTDLTRFRINNSPDGVDTYNCTYGAVGTYTMEIKATSKLDSQTCSHSFKVLTGVKNNFQVTSNAPVDYDVTSDCSMSFTVTYTDPMPDDAELILDYGDGNNVTQPFTTPVTTLNYIHPINPGHYTCTLTIWNDASRQTRTFNCGCYSSFGGVNLDVKREPRIPIGSPDTNPLYPDTFNQAEPIKLYTSLTGTFVYWEISAMSTSYIINCNSTERDVTTLDIDQPGTYTVDVRPYNPVHDGPTVSRTIRVMSPASDIVIDEQGGLIHDFHIQMESPGTDMCFAIDYGDNSHNEIYTHGDPAVCPPISNHMILFPGKVAVAHSSANISWPFSSTYNFTEMGTYTLKAIAYNWVSVAEKNLTYAVSGVDCSKPNLKIKNQKPHFDNPLYVKRRYRTKIAGFTQVDCQDTWTNTKNWYVYQVDNATGEDITQIDISSLSTRRNAELAIPALFLEYGKYKLVYEVTMETSGKGTYFGTAETFISVGQSPLEVMCDPYGTSSVTVGVGGSMTIDAFTHSRDPDDGGSINTFKWECRCLSCGEEFAEVEVPVFGAGVPPLHTDIGGCFHTGPGILQGATSGILTFQASVFKAGNIYQFRITGQKNGQSASFLYEVNATDGNPPKTAMVPLIPTLFNVRAESDGISFNPNSQLGFRAAVLDEDPSCQYSFFWQAYAHDYQYCNCCACWRPLDYLHQHIEGVHSDELAIHSSLFEHYYDIDLFKVDLETTCDDGASNSSGITSLNLTRNHPPTGGNCTVEPNTGWTFKTNFNISCFGFVDNDPDDAVADYEVKCKSNGDTWVTVARGDYPFWEDRYLPPGDPDNADSLECAVVVTDDKGSSAEYKLDDLTVVNLPIDDLLATLNATITQDRNDYDEMDVTAILDNTAAIAIAFAPALNSFNNKYEDQGGQTATTWRRSHYNSNTRPSAFTAEDKNETFMVRYEEQREAATGLVEKIAKTLTKCTKESVEEVIRLSQALEELTNAVVSNSLNTQHLVLGLLNGAATSAKTYSADLSVEKATYLAEKIIGTCNSIQQSARVNREYPSYNDVKAQTEAVPYFDTSKISYLEEIPHLDNDEAKLKAGKRALHRRDEYYAMNEIVDKCDSIFDTMTGLITDKTVASQTTTLNSKNSQTWIHKIPKGNKKHAETSFVPVGGCTVEIPDLSSTSEEVVVAVSASTSPRGIQLKGHAQLPSFYSEQVKMTIRNSKGKHKKMDNIPPIRVRIGQDKYAPKPDIKDQPYLVPLIQKGELAFFEIVNVTQPRSAIKKVYSFNETIELQFLVLVSYLNPPKIQDGKHNIIQVCQIPSDTRYAGDDNEDHYSCFLDSETVGDNLGKYFFSIRPLRTDEYNDFGTLEDFQIRHDAEHWVEERDFPIAGYWSKSEKYACFASKEGETKSSSKGLTVLRSSTPDSLDCSSTHLTTFGGDWAVAPNTIDWNFVFSNADFLKNPTLYVTEIVIALFYIIAMIWARRQDRQDVEKLGLAPLPCNDQQDKYYYEIMVSTGMRRGAGTESKVHFILSGEEEETEVRTFEDKKRKIFCRGTTDGFLMSVPSPLGALMYLRIWHDNSGKGRNASWYLNHVIVRDVQTEKKYYFIGNKWFAVEEDDGQVDRVIPIAGKEQMTEFSHLFAEKATKNLSDGHLWFSVVARPPQSRFTRCQRVSCCLCLLYSSMLANAMFYGTETADSNAFTLGPFALTSQQVFIGIVCNIIVFPVNFLLIHLFRKSRPRKLRPSRLEEALKSNTERSTSMADVNPRVKSSLDCERPGSSFLMDAKRSTTAMSRPESSMSSTMETSKKKKKCELPWWFTIIAWIILWLVVLTSAAFVTFYGISFQDMKCKKWITSMLISFFTSVFLTQPIKVFLFAIVFSLIIKNPGGDEDEDDDEEAPKKIECDEEYLHEEEDDDFGLISPRKPLYKPKPLDTKALESARKQRLKEIQMWAVIREILFYAFFLWILMVISYRSVNNNSYNYKHNMEKVFIITNNTNTSFTKIKNTPDFWSWAKSGMLKGLRAGKTYNDFPAFYMRGYINDKVSRLMGPAVLRQVRIQPDTCTLSDYMDGVIEECNGMNSITLEQDGDFGPGWTPLTANNSREEYKYRSASELDGYPFWGESALYGGGGYIVDLNTELSAMVNHLEQLEQEGWVDKYTRVVFLEFTVYNPSINLFAISTLAAEFRPSGGVFPTYRFEPCNLLPYMNSGLLLQIACEIIYLAFTIFFLVTLFRNLVKQKTEYFTQFWNLVDLGICAMSVTAIVIYFYRLVCMNALTEFFHETQGDGYAKFQYVGYWSEIFNYIIGFLVFFATLKFMKLLRFNKKISLLSDTLKNSSKDLMHFSIIFNVTFLAFIQLFYLVYMSHLDNFKTFLGSCEAGIVMMMGKFDIYNMLAVNQWLTQIFIFLFVVTITFIVVNMLLSILNDTFSAVRNDKNKQKNDYEIVDFMLTRFKTWTGIGRGSTTISPAELEKQRKAKNLEEQVDKLPDQIDRFLASISNMYIGDAKFDSFLQKGMAKKMAMKAQAQDPLVFHQAPAPRLPGSQRLSHGVRGMTDVQTD